MKMKKKKHIGEKKKRKKEPIHQWTIKILCASCFGDSPDMTIDTISPAMVR